MSGQAASVGRLHVLTDVTLQDRFDHPELARLAALGGADTVQYRDKRRLDEAVRLHEARRLEQVLRPHGVTLIVNDHVAVAAAIRGAGVHLGANDADPAAARRELGPAALIGATANDRGTALRVANAPVDYLGVGPVFGTRSKRDPAPALGLEGLREIVAAVGLPVVAIGSITADRVAEVLETGAWGVAVLSAFVGAADPAEAVRALREAVDACCGAAS
jgi:thiamine-phosphate pyrophosphorylase